MKAEHHSDEKWCFYKDNIVFRSFLYTDYSMKPHDHDFYEINIILNGNGKHIIASESIEVKAGDIFVIPPTTVHAYSNTKNLDVYHILIKRSFIYENSQEAYKVPGFLQFMEIEPFLRQNFSGAKFLRLSPKQMLDLKKDLNLIDDNTYTDDDYIPLKIHTLWKIIYTLSNLMHLQNKSENRSSDKKYDNDIIKVLEYIHQNYDSKISVELLSQKAYMSRSTFIRRFQHICNMTPMEYVNKYRTEKALEMMSNTFLSKTEIAHKCGFYDLSHMMRKI